MISNGPTDRMDAVADPRLVDGRYELRSVLGIGGMAEVHLAYDTKLERLVAVKMLLPEFSTNARLLERFRREALMLAMVESPYVVPVYDVSIVHNAAYLVMRYLRGSTLSTIIATSG